MVHSVADHMRNRPRGRRTIDLRLARDGKAVSRLSHLRHRLIGCCQSRGGHTDKGYRRRRKQRVTIMAFGTTYFMTIGKGMARFGAAMLAGVIVAVPAHAQLEDIMKQLDATGQARVIVRMQDVLQPGRWEGAVSVIDQRAAVRSMRRSFDSALLESDIVIDRSFSSLPFVGVKLDRERLGALMTLSEVAGVYPVTIERKAQVKVRPALTSSTPSIDVTDAWALGHEGQDQTIAVIDGGFDTSHAMLSNKVVGEACFSATFGTDTFSQCPGGITPQIGFGAASNCPSDSNRCDHGTHVASIAVGNDGTNYGVARAANLMPIDVFSEVTDDEDCSPNPAPCELTDSLAVLDALNYVNENAEDFNVVAVNLSLGGGENMGPCDSDPRKVVVDMLREKGVATIAASGNEGYDDAINAPACISSVLSVGATNDKSVVAAFTNVSSHLDFMAPGISIRAARAGGGLVTRSGTSMAVPHLAGAIAVIRSAFPEATVDEIDEALTRSGIPVTKLDLEFDTPRILVNQAILTLQGINVRVFNNVIGSRTTDVGQSFIRLYNSSDEDGRARVSLRDSETGARLGRWISPNIPAHASFQFNVSKLESEAAADVAIATDERTYYNLVVETEFEGSMQHVLWQRNAGVISNMTSCADGVDGGERSLLNVHSPNVVQYPSSVRIYNSGTAGDSATLDIYNASTGERLGTWNSGVIDAGAAQEITIAELVEDLELEPNENNTLADSAGNLPTHINIEMQESFTGHMQHTVRNTISNVLTDMSAKCALGN